MMIYLGTAAERQAVREHYGHRLTIVDYPDSTAIECVPCGVTVVEVQEQEDE